MDTALALTRGNPVGLWAALANMRLEHGSYTGVLRPGGGKPPLIGQIHYNPGERAARIAYILPIRGLDSPELGKLLEHLAWAAGDSGALSLLAEIDETSPALESLRRCGFGVYAWQRVWKIARNPEGGADRRWEPATDLDRLAIRSLFQSLVPPLVQSAEPLSERTEGFVYEQNGEMLGYIEAVFGPNGIYLQPLIHPASEDVPRLLGSFLARLPFHLGRPAYFSVRSYQAWLEKPLAELQAEAGERQALLVKHLAAAQRASAYAVRNGALEKHQPALIDTQGGETPLPLLPRRLAGKGPVKSDFGATQTDHESS
jgi:hypothetical protein